MNEKREQPQYKKSQSLNEPYRRRQVDKINLENKRLAERLQKTQSLISNKKFENDYKKHVAAESNLRRRQMKPLAIPKDLYSGSPIRGSSSGLASSSSNMNISSEYITQRTQYLRDSSSLETLGFHTTNGAEGFSNSDGSPVIQSVQDFRKHVLSKKKMNKSDNSLQFNSLNSSSYNIEDLKSEDGPFGGRNPHQNSMYSSKNDSLFEMNYVPR